MAVQTKAETLKGALARLARSAAKPPEITKLPADDPKPAKGDKSGGMASYDSSQWPVCLRLDDKQLPFLAKASAGDEVVLLIKAKVDNVTTSEKEGTEPTVRAELTLLEVAKL